MNISPINNISYTNKNYKTNNSQAVNKPIPFDSVTFCAKEKPTLLDKIKSLFNKNDTDVEIELTEEERKDATIRGTFKGMFEAAKEYHRVAKIEVKTLNTLLKIGKLQDFKPYLPYDKGKKLLFGGFDKNNLPTKLDIVNFNGEMSIDKSYDFGCGSSLFSTTIRYSQRSNTKLDIVNGKPLYMVDKNYEDGNFQRMTFLDNAVHYMSGPLNNRSDISRMGQMAYYDYKNPEKCYYIDLDDVEDVYNYYEYNIDKNFWEITKKMSFEEMEEFIQSQEF